MKKIKGLFLLIVGALLLPITVLAAPTTELTGVIYARPGDTVAYDIKITSPDEEKAIKYEAELSYDKEILDLKGVTAKSWNGNNSSNNLTFTYKDGISGTSTIATVTFKVKDNVPKQTTIITLKNIKITTLDENNSKNLVAVSESASHKVSLAIKSTDNSLKDLKVDGVTVAEFKSDVYEYEMEVSSDTDKIELKATPNNANATFVDGFGSREVDVKYGENEFLIKVKSEAGDIQVYKILVTREDNRNTNNNLKEVLINSGKIKLELSKNKTDYTIKTYKLKKLEVDAVAVDSKATVKVEIPEQIIVGENVVIITVTSENGEEKKYTITFDNTDKAVDTKIKTLYIKGYKLDFDKNTMVYEVTFNKKFKKGLDMSIVTVSGDKAVTYTIYYNGVKVDDNTKIDLKVGDKYEIKVSPIGLEEGDDSDTTTYTITIVKDKRVSFYLVLELFITLVLVVLIVIQIFKRKKILENNKKKASPKTEKVEEVKEEQIKNEIEKTKVISDDELDKINNVNEE